MRGATLIVCLGVLAPRALAQDDARVTVTVLVDGDGADAVRAAARGPHDGLPIDVTVGVLPSRDAAAPPTAPHGEALAAARAAYVSAEFDRCLAGLGDDTAVHAALADGRRELAARLLFWRIACRVGAGDALAAEDARRFATFGLEVPPDVEAASPEVEQVVGDALGAAADAARATVEVRSTPTATVAIDGRAAQCETPCRIDLPIGDHVVALQAPGRVPAWNLVRAGAAEAATLALDEAPPELAARQWAEAWIGRDGRDSPASVRLLAQAVRARRLVLFLADRDPRGARLSGVLALDGVVAARAERGALDAVDRATRELLRDLLVQGGAVESAPPVHESPWFWIGIAAGVAIAATVTAVIALEVDTTTRVRF